MADIFALCVFELRIYCQGRFQKLSLLTNWNYIFLIYFWNKFPNQIKNSNNVKKLKAKLDGFIKNGQKKNLRGYFSELSNQLLYRI